MNKGSQSQSEYIVKFWMGHLTSSGERLNESYKFEKVVL